MKWIGGRLALVLSLVLLAATAARGAWHSIGKVTGSEVKGDQITFHTEHAMVRLSVLAPEIVRVRMAHAAAFGPDYSWAVVKKPRPVVPLEISRRPNLQLIRTGKLVIHVQLSPLRLAFYDAGGKLISRDSESLGMAWDGAQVRCWKNMPPDEHYFGLGENAGRLDKRGNAYVMWNTDNPYWGATTTPLYESVPFFIALRQGHAYGIFFDNTYRASFDLGVEFRNRYSFGAEGGEMNYYFFYGPGPKKVLEEYTGLTGRMPLPPRWALGYNQCRYSYYPEKKVRFIADNFRLRHIPCDVLFLDIDYMDGYRVFTWNRQRFPDPAGMIADLRKQGFHVVTILDPGIKVDPNYWVYKQGLAGNDFVRMPDGKLFVGKVWPGDSVFPDFTSPRARAWWGTLYKGLVADGVAGFWNDMNEPSVFGGPGGTMPLNAVFDDHGLHNPQAKIHNVYGMQMSRATEEGVLKLRPNRRTFVLTRATFAGGQRYAAVWTGDNTATWQHLRISIRELMSMGLSGLTFAGADIGGFMQSPSPRLYARWLEAGIFYPYCRTHTNKDTENQEPWSYGDRITNINRRSIDLRYELMPYLYNVFYQASRTGLPVMRALLLDYPDDPKAVKQDGEFLFGHDLLVAPVMEQYHIRPQVYLPRGQWTNYWTNRTYMGPREVTVEAPLGRIPIFVRGGAIIPTQQLVQYTVQAPINPLTFKVYPDGSSSRQYYEDDGETFDYRQGDYLLERVSVDARPKAIDLAISARRGSYTPPARSVEFEVHGVECRPQGVRTEGTALAEAGSGKAFQQAASGWLYDQDDKIVRIKFPDQATARQVAIEK